MQTHHSFEHHTCICFSLFMFSSWCHKMGVGSRIAAKLLLFVLLVALVMVDCVAGTATARDRNVMCLENERQALLRFKHGLVDEHDMLTSWGVGEENNGECCIWKGVMCSNTTNHVIALQLPGDGSTGWLYGGNISDALLDLHHLEILDLSSNSFFEQQIPGFIGSFKNLRHLNLGSNSFSGVVPSQLGNLTKLKTLDLGNNYLHVNNLDWLSHLSLLSRLDLSRTNITDTKWMQVISSLPSLKQLDFSYGTLPQLTPYFSMNTSSFPSLARVNLSDTGVNSLILPWLLNMSTSLVSIYLSSNQLVGSIPEAFGNLVYLEYLDLSGNALEGRVPISFRNLSNLQYLDLSYNTLEGNISESVLSNLPNLKVLGFSFNSLALNYISTGWVPPFQLDALQLAHCRMGPRFPKWIQTQNKISHLDLSSGGISDYVPEWLWDLSPKLTFLNLSHNQLSGSVPDLSSKFVGYPQIDISFNNLSGSLSLFPPNSTVLQLSRNIFQGPIPSFCTYNKLRVLDLSYNQLSGRLPGCLINATGGLWILDLSNNSISGEIPCMVCPSELECELEALVLRNNNFSGELPSCLRYCSEMGMFDVGGNQLTGTIPVWLGTNMFWLSYLNLRGNEFHGMIPLELCGLSGIQVLDLSRNNISGRIPQCFSNFTSLAQYDGMVNYFLDTYGASSVEGWSYDISSYIQNVYITWKRKETESKQPQLQLIDLSSNKLVGNIPKDFFFMKALISLNLSRNHLTGKIDSHIGEMKMLECLDLSRNELSGEIPTSLAQLNFLAVLDLSSNNLSGAIPSSRQLDTFDASTFARNDGLCGPPLAQCPVAADSPPILPTNDGKHNHWDVGLYMSVACGFVLGFWGAIGVSFFPSLRRNGLFNFWNRVWNWVYVTSVVYMRRLG